MLFERCPDGTSHCDSMNLARSERISISVFSSDSLEAEMSEAIQSRVFPPDRCHLERCFAWFCLTLSFTLGMGALRLLMVRINSVYQKAGRNFLFACWETSTPWLLSLFRLVDCLAAHHRPQYLSLKNLRRTYRRDIAIQNDKVRQHPRFECSLLFLRKLSEG